MFKFVAGVGFTLKKEDSGALKELIFKTQKKANDADIDSYTDKYVIVIWKYYRQYIIVL